jgi:hypothetical protein
VSDSPVVDDVVARKETQVPQFSSFCFCPEPALVNSSLLIEFYVRKIGKESKEKGGKQEIAVFRRAAFL